MKVSRQQAAENRRKVLELASQAFREKGFDGIGVAELMKQAGLTHGGFYAQFGSKENLMAEATEHAFQGLAQEYTSLTKLATSYLRPEHCGARGQGCPMAALAIDVARQANPEIRQAFTSGFRGAVENLAKCQDRQQALAGWSTLVGALILARAVDDPSFSQEILAAARQQLAGSETP